MERSKEIGRWSSNAYLCIVYDCQESRTAAIENGKLERRLFMIEPYQFHSIKHQVYQLVRTYQSVNDPRTIKTVETMTKDAIEQFFLKKKQRHVKF